MNNRLRYYVRNSNSNSNRNLLRHPEFPHDPLIQAKHMAEIGSRLRSANTPGDLPIGFRSRLPPQHGPPTPPPEMARPVLAGTRADSLAPEDCLGLASDLGRDLEDEKIEKMLFEDTYGHEEDTEILSGVLRGWSDDEGRDKAASTEKLDDKDTNVLSWADAYAISVKENAAREKARKEKLDASEQFDTEPSSWLTQATSYDDNFDVGCIRSRPIFTDVDGRYHCIGFQAGDTLEGVGLGDSHTFSTDAVRDKVRREEERRRQLEEVRTARLKNFDAYVTALPLETPEKVITSIEPTDPIPAYTLKFEKFLELPPEIKGRIYSYALSNDGPIRPHLCDSTPSDAIKFHDSAQHSRLHPNHGSINALLGITLVSKFIRAESLPLFYSSNTFAVGPDTPTYFAHLQTLGRFHLIRNVRFSIHMNAEKWTAQYLEQMTTYLKATEAYELIHTNGGIKGYEFLVNHPRYNAAGLTEMALMICLRMLSSTFPSSTTSTTQTPTFVLPIPNATHFAGIASLAWIPGVCRGLGIHLRFLEGHELAYSGDGVIGVVWRQKFQKKEFGCDEEGEKGGKAVKARVQEIYPDLQKRIIWERCSYYRTTCDGMRYKWFAVKT
jgi:hypothetical protein